MMTKILMQISTQDCPILGRRAYYGVTSDGKIIRVDIALYEWDNNRVGNPDWWQYEWLAEQPRWQKAIANGLFTAEQLCYVENFDQDPAIPLNLRMDLLAQAVRTEMQPPAQAEATAATLIELGKIATWQSAFHHGNLYDIAAGWRFLAQNGRADKDPAVTQRRVTCGELAALAEPYTGGIRGDLNKACRIWQEWQKETSYKGRREDDPRQQAMARTFEREQREMEDALHIDIGDRVRRTGANRTFTGTVVGYRWGKDDAYLHVQWDSGQQEALNDAEWDGTVHRFKLYKIVEV